MPSNNLLALFHKYWWAFFCILYD